MKQSCRNWLLIPDFKSQTCSNWCLCLCRKLVTTLFPLLLLPLCVFQNNPPVSRKNFGLAQIILIVFETALIFREWTKGPEVVNNIFLKGIAGKRWNQAANSVPPHTTHPHTLMVPWAPELSRGQCWQLSLTKIAMNEKLVRSLPRKRFCHQPLSYGLGGENRGNHSRGFFPLGELDLFWQLVQLGRLQKALERNTHIVH